MASPRVSPDAPSRSSGHPTYVARQRRQWARYLLVWFHAVTSIGWMSLALCLCILLVLGTPGALDAAQVLDESLLQHLATSAAFSGLMLAALTPWGYFRYWWVLTKFAITLTQLYMGIFVLGPRLATAHAGDTFVLLASSALMASAIAFQAWLSVAKPWPATPWSVRRIRPPSGPQWMYLAAVAIPVLDYAFVRVVFNAPAPVVSFLVALTFPLWRRTQLRPNAARSPAPTDDVVNVARPRRPS
jgi:hypothetical protein